MYSYDSVWYFRLYAVDIGLRLKYLNSKKSLPQVCLWHNALSNVSFRRKNLLFTQCLGDLCQTTQTILITIPVTIEKMTATTITIRLTTRIIGTRRIMGMIKILHSLEKIKQPAYTRFFPIASRIQKYLLVHSGLIPMSINLPSLSNKLSWCKLAKI